MYPRDRKGGGLIVLILDLSRETLFQCSSQIVRRLPPLTSHGPTASTLQNMANVHFQTEFSLSSRQKPARSYRKSPCSPEDLGLRMTWKLVQSDEQHSERGGGVKARKLGGRRICSMSVPGAGVPPMIRTWLCIVMLCYD